MWRIPSVRSTSCSGVFLDAKYCTTIFLIISNASSNKFHIQTMSSNSSSIASSTTSSPFHFRHLPLELQLLVISHLSPLDTYTLRLTNTFYATLLPSPSLQFFLALEHRAWLSILQTSKPPSRRQLYIRAIPRFLVCRACERYRPSAEFHEWETEYCGQRPGKGLGGERRCRGCGEGPIWIVGKDATVTVN